MQPADTLLSIEDALLAVRAEATPRPSRSEPLEDATGCVLAESIKADRDSPPFDKALMDGYAVRGADFNDNPTRSLKLGETLLAGQVPSRGLLPGEAASIMTGAPMPPGADAVVMLEHTIVNGDRVTIPEGFPLPEPGRNMLPRGREMRTGEIVLEAGQTLNPPAIGVLASVGCTRPRVIPRIRLAIVPTGDELVEPDVLPGPGQIRNSNASLLRALAIQHGAAVTVHPIARDETEVLRTALAAALESADVVLVTGGVSTGSHDLVPPTLASLGMRTVFHKIRMKPGKPLLFGVGSAPGTDHPGPLVFGLPGNPVSGLVGFLLFVRPAIQAMAGYPWRDDLDGPYPLASSFKQRGDRPAYFPARVVPTASGLAIEPLPWAGSADLRAIAKADGFARFPAGDYEYQPGDLVRFLPLSRG